MPPRPQVVAYYRVSTDKQGLKALGMEAQREAVSRFMTGKGKLAAEFVEVESGPKDSNRPQLHAALAECRKRHAVLVIAKPDRLARNMHFISGRMNSDVEFVAVDMPSANRLTIHILAAEAAIIARAAKNIQPPPPEVLRLITGWRAEGRGLRDITRELNRLNICTPQGRSGMPVQ